MRSFVQAIALVAVIAATASCTKSAPSEALCTGSASIGHFVSLPEKTILLGDTVYAEEGPRRQATVQAFAMLATEVTNAQFAAFVRATGYVTRAERGLSLGEHPDIQGEFRRPGSAVFDMPGPQTPEPGWRFVAGADWRHPAGPSSSIAGRDAYPVVHVSQEDALAYAKWRGERLPSEAEFESAARDGATQDGPQDSPADANSWQGAFPKWNSGADGHKGLAPVGCYHANRYGLHDLIGNVWEWTADRVTNGRAVIKGGSYLCAKNYCMRYRPGAREFEEVDFSASHIGFRTVKR